MGATAQPGDDDAEAGHEPERTCAVTREKHAPEDLIRFVAAPDGTIVPDIASKLPGRGVWVGNWRGTVEEAERSNCFARSLKKKITVPQGLAAQVEALLVKRALEALSLACKAGSLKTGFTKVDVAIGKGEAFALVHAAEAAGDGCGKLDRKYHAVLAEMAEDGGARHEPRIVTEFGSDELSLATGRPYVVHAALARSGAAERFLREAGRLRRYRAASRIRAAEPPNPGSGTDRV